MFEVLGSQTGSATTSSQCVSTREINSMSQNQRFALSASLRLEPMLARVASNIRRQAARSINGVSHTNPCKSAHKD
jgi:hypothetical protein